MELIKPAVAKSKGIAGDPLENAVRKNVKSESKASGTTAHSGAPSQRWKVKVVGRVYDLSTGGVTLVGTEKQL